MCMRENEDSGEVSDWETCLQVINNDVNTTTNYTLEANIVSDNRTLVTSEQASLANIYSQCCSATGACTYWKSLNANSSTNANGGGVVTDFCSFPGQVCTPTGCCLSYQVASMRICQSLASRDASILLV